MKRLRVQAKLHGWQLSECRRRVIDLEGLAECFEEEIAAVDAEMAAASAAADPSDDGQRALADHLEAAAERRANLERSLERVRREMEEAREAVRLAFQELRKYELAIAARLEAEASQQRRRAANPPGLDGGRSNRRR